MESGCTGSIQFPLVVASDEGMVAMKFDFLLEAVQRKLNKALYNSILRLLIKDHHFLYSDPRVIARLSLFEYFSRALGNRSADLFKNKIIDQAATDFMKMVPFEKRKFPR